MTTDKIYYFARERHMASVVWDKKTNSALAEFTKSGVYATTIESKAKRLLNMGYLQVSREQVVARNLPVPIPDEAPTADFQPGAPGRGYTHEDGAAPPDSPEQPKPFNELQSGTPGNPEFPEGPPGGKRTLR